MQRIISDVHAMVTFDPFKNVFRIVDVSTVFEDGSSNGIFVDFVKASKHERCPLKHNNSITFGGPEHIEEGDFLSNFIADKLLTYTFRGPFQIRRAMHLLEPKNDSFE